MKRVRKPSRPEGVATAGEPAKGVVQMSDSRRILPGSSRNAAPGAKLVGRTDARAKVDVTVVLVRKQPIERDDLHRHALMRPHERPQVDHAAFAQQYGASDEAIAALRAHAVKYGLTVTNVDRARRVVELSGSASNMEQAFGTVLNDYTVAGHTHRGRRGPLLLPTAIAPHVEAVLGLDNRPVAKPRLKSRSVQASYYPQQIAALYKFPPGDGNGETVALIEL